MANLDDDSKMKILRMNKQNVTLINSTHDPDRFQNVDAVFKTEIINDIKFIKKLLNMKNISSS